MAAPKRDYYEVLGVPKDASGMSHDAVRLVDSSMATHTRFDNVELDGDRLASRHAVGQGDPGPQTTTLVVHFGLREIKRVVPFNISRTHVVADGETDNPELG